MRKTLKNVLIFGATSDMAEKLIRELLSKKVNVYAISRSILKIDDENLTKYNADLTSDIEIDEIFKKISEIKFDAVINFQGIAISSPVEFLTRENLQYQFDISLFSLLRIVNNLKNKLDKNSLFVNISSMASFGVFPFIAPYSMAKASADILLNSFEMETGVKCVSIKPGVVGTKFWEFCIKENRENFEKFKGKYEDTGKFLLENAKKNSKKGINPEKVSELILRILVSPNPRSSYLIGLDAYLACILSYFKGRILFKLINKVLNLRIKRAQNEK